MAGIWQDGSPEKMRLRAQIMEPANDIVLRHIPRSLQSSENFRRILCVEQEKLLEKSNAKSTKKTSSSHWTFWLLNCHWVAIDPDEFASENLLSREVLEEEDDVLIEFKQVVSVYPRDPAKKKLSGTREGRNSSGCAGQCVSKVRLYYERRGRRTVGIWNEIGRGSLRMAAVTKSLQKLEPAAKEPRHPILPQHMQALWIH